MNKEELFNDLKQKSELIPDEHDGSYELMREIVGAYEKLNDYSVCTIRDLNAVHAMAIGSWRLDAEKKKDYVNKGCLPDSEKKHMADVIDRVWDNACHIKYSNVNTPKHPAFGMFGAGFYSFENKASDANAQDFIKMLVDISNMSDDDQMFERVEIMLSRPLKGLQTASVSIILHCLKPMSFPVINGNSGHGTIFEVLGIDLDQPIEKSVNYISNCRKIKKYRDSHFEFKNYRIMDMEAWKLETGSKAETKEDGNKIGDKEFAFNTILYGPPGTGKTYNTVRYAVSICKPDLDIDNMEYSEILKEYDRLKAEGRIEFTTFHQSYGYEEFIEGIKPVVDSDSSDIGYTIEAGIFKRFCESAKVVKENTPYTGEVWVVRNRAGDKNVASDFEEVLYAEGLIKIEDINDENRQCDFFNDMASGDWVVFGKKYTINAIGVIIDDAPEEIEDGIFHYQRKVEWKATGLSIDCRDINRGRSISNFTIAKSWMKVQDLQKIVDGKTRNEEPYVFIIDEINRGNISKIFGELITLIEETKRDGAEEAMETTLPYSGDRFSVPDNVYIIGTMNTADRSIALMDTALRRRFEFVEMMPDTKVLNYLSIGIIEDNGVELNVSKMLEVINKRIEFLYDREHTIGHAFFTSLKDNPSIKQLSFIFKKKVIPLLQEYFYEDYGKIQLVLGDNQKAEDADKFVLDIPTDISSVFNGTPDIDLPEKTYIIQEKAFGRIESYKAIGKGL